MNKKSIVAASALLLVLTGCKDAHIAIKDADTPIVTVGNKTITKGEVFNIMMATYGASNAVSTSNNKIAAAEIEITDEMKKSAQDTINTYKSLYGDVFTEYLESSGMTEEDYMNEYLIPSLQSEKLITKYLEENYDSVCEMYTPVKAMILEFSSNEDAQSALSALKDGSKTPAEVIEEYNGLSTADEKIITNDSTSVDSMIKTVIFSATPADGWTYVPSSDGTTFDVVKVVENDPDNMKEEVLESLAAISNVQNDSTTYFFKKYGFHIYDKTLYDAVSLNYPDNLVQDLPKE